VVEAQSVAEIVNVNGIQNGVGFGVIGGLFDFRKWLIINETVFDFIFGLAKIEKQSRRKQGELDR
jgi:hypothetical protein